MNQTPPDKSETCRRILGAIADRAKEEIWKPKPDYRSLAEQMRQNAELVLAELAEAEVESR